MALVCSTGKVVHTKAFLAIITKKKIFKETGKKLRVYKCRCCTYYHLTKQGVKQTPKSKL